MTLDDVISAVTVYTDRAQVTRTATIKLSKGEHQLVFDNLPADTQPNSLQVSGSGPAVIGSVRFATVHFTQAQDPRRKTLLDKRQQVSDSIADDDSAIARAKSEKAFIESIAKKLTGVTPNSAPAELDPDRWIQITAFYRQRLDVLDTEIKTTERSKRALGQELETIDSELSDIGEQEDRERNQAQVSVSCTADGDVTLNLSYVVYGPSWEPVYDIRVQSRARTLALACNALVRQATSEPWNNVRLSLSTAQPQVGGVEPKLSPWRVDFYRPAPPPATRSDMVQFQRRAKASMAPQEESSDDSSLELCASESEAPMEVAQATVQSGATSALFVIAGASTIGNDNAPQRVTITQQEFPAEFTYSTTPRLAQRAYLRAKARNQSEFPLLAGESNVFLDGTFVATSQLDLVAPGQEFVTFLGVDESIKVEHLFVRRYQKDEGVITKKTRFIYEYLFKITNSRATEERIVLRDQLPIASHQDIAVELLEPKPGRENSPRTDEQSLLEWDLKLKAGERLQMPFSFAVEYPRGQTLSGL